MEAPHGIEDKGFDCLESLLIITNHSDKIMPMSRLADKPLAENALPNAFFAHNTQEKEFN